MAVQQKSNYAGLITVLGTAILSAFLLAGLTLYHFGPSGQYTIRKALVDPMLLQNMSFNQLNSKTGGESRFVFDKMVYSFYDASKRGVQAVPVTFDQYKTFYALILGETSIADVSPSVEALFDSAQPATLRLDIRTEGSSALQRETQMFQEIQFANEGNFYRIALREEQSPVGKWAYYYHPEISEKVRNLFTHD